MFSNNNDTVLIYTSYVHDSVLYDLDEGLNIQNRYVLTTSTSPQSINCK